MSVLRRAFACALIALGILAASAGPALAHATLLGSTPSARAVRVDEDTKQVVLRFSEPVQIINRSDISVVGTRGYRIDKGQARTLPTDARKVVVPLRTPMLPDSYTVRARVVADDSHSTSQVMVFAVAGAPLSSPILAGSGGLTDTSPASVAARIAELAALGLLLGLLGFRALVWGPAVAIAGTRGVSEDDRERGLAHGQKLFWRAFWGLAVLAGVAEAVVLAAKSAVVFHTGLIASLLQPAAAYHLVAASRFGDLLGWRSAALFLLVAVAFVTWNSETAGPPSAGRRGPSAVMAFLAVTALTLLASQGHASQAPLAPLSIAADAVHLGGAALWVGGLPCLVAVLVRAPRLMPDAGRALASATLARFSKIALLSVAVIAVTGFARLAGELSSPTELWTTAYGRDIMLKADLLLPILFLARRNRRVVAALSDGGWTPSAAKLRSVARSVQIELAIAAGIIAVAALLVAQVPGRV
jgi:copper transport protein